MDNQQNHCVFCGANTEEQHQTRFGLIYLHSECLGDLEEITSTTEEKMGKI